MDLIATQMMDSIAIKTTDLIVIYLVEAAVHMQVTDRLLCSVNIVLHKMDIIVIRIKDKCAITLEKIYGAIPIIIHKIVTH